MTEPKTTRNQTSVADFLASVPDPDRRADAQVLCDLMTEVTGAPPVMWGSGIVGFGAYHYRYASGREGDWPAVGFSPRKTALTVYVSEGFDAYHDLLAQLGPHRTGKSCLYLKRLSDAEEPTLRALVEGCFRQLDGTTVSAAPD